MVFNQKKKQEMLEQALTKVVSQNIKGELDKFMKTFDETARNIVRDEFKKLSRKI